MVWFYKRDQSSLSVETRYDNETAEYVAIVVRPDGLKQTERFLYPRGVSRVAHGARAATPIRALGYRWPGACPAGWLAAQTTADVRSIG